MWVAGGRLVLDFFNNTDMALKKRNIDELCKEARRKFNISIVEVDAFDEPEKCAVGFSVTMPTHWNRAKAHGFVQKICKDLDETAFARVTSEHWELYSPE